MIKMIKNWMIFYQVVLVSLAWERCILFVHALIFFCWGRIIINAVGISQPVAKAECVFFPFSCLTLLLASFVS